MGKIEIGVMNAVLLDGKRAQLDIKMGFDDDWMDNPIGMDEETKCVSVFNLKVSRIGPVRTAEDTANR